MSHDDAPARPSPRPAPGVTARLVGLMDTLARGASPPGMIDMFPRASLTDPKKSVLRRRFTMIAGFDRNAAKSRRWSAAGVALSLSLVAVALTGAVRGQGQDEQPKQDDAAQTAAQRSNPNSPAPPARPGGGEGDGSTFTEEDAQRLWQTKYADRIIVVNGREANREEVDQQFLREVEARKRRAQSGEPAQPPPAFVEVQTKEDRAVEAQLARPIPELNFDAVAFSDVIDFLREVSGANVHVEWGALEAAGVDRNATVTVRVKNVRFSDALEMVLQSAGKNAVALGYASRGGVLRISTQEDLDRLTEIRAYDVRDIVPAEMEMKQLATLIADAVDPSSWRDAGGTTGSLHTSKHKLIVTTTEANHRQIRSILQMLREQPDQGPRTENAANTAQARPGR